MTPAVIPGAGVGEENENWDEEYEGTSRKARKAANRKANATAAADEGKIGEGKGKPMSAKARSKAVWVPAPAVASRYELMPTIDACLFPPGEQRPSGHHRFWLIPLFAPIHGQQSASTRATRSS